MELHGGRVEARSPGPGRGSTFVVTLPLMASPPGPPVVAGSAPTPARMPHAPAAAGDVDLAGVRVLVVDDDPDARDLVRRVLAERRAEVTTAGSAAEGLRLMGEIDPDVLLSNIGMPDLDGYEFIRRVRATRFDASHLPAAALTAFARPDDRRRALEAGYQAHLSKPLQAAALIAEVARLARRDTAGPENGQG